MSAGCSFRVAGTRDTGDLASGGGGGGGASSDLATGGGGGGGGGGGAGDLAVASGDLAAGGPSWCGQTHVVGCWEFEDTIGSSVAKDGTASGNDLALGAGALLIAGGKIGQALSVGAGAVVQHKSATHIDVTPITLEMWIHPTTLPALMSSRSFVLDEALHYAVLVGGNGGVRCSFADGSDNPLIVDSSAGQAAVGQWLHIACTYDGSKALLYLNGKLAVSVTAGQSGSVPTGSTNLCVGMSCAPGNGSAFDGLIDEVRILDVALPQTALCVDAMSC